MKLLFDQNISFRVVKLILDEFPKSAQVRELGLEGTSDFEIFNYALKNNFVIVTFDSDFCDLNMLKGSPPKIIWIRTGNTITKNIAKIILEKTELIYSFGNNDFGCLEITSIS